MLSQTSQARERVAAAARLVGTVRHAFREFAAAADRLHADLEVSAAMRVVLEMLDEDGPLTVPQMARRKNVSRQNFQVRTDLLIAAGLVELQPNPAHARSRLVALTGRGREVFGEVRRREAEVFAKASAGLTAADLEMAEQVLRQLVAGIRTAEAAKQEEKDGTR